MAEIVLKNIYKYYNDVLAVDNLSLTINDHEFVTLVGPSGCGKTTTLNMVAGLIDLSDGEIRIGGRIVNDLDPKDRDIAMVFQNYALYPHKTVRQNLEFPLRMRKVDKAIRDQRINRAAEILGIGNLLDRRPKELSGGQQQRVALGRAIVRDPAAFLMDEPLSNLDAKLRVHMRAELKHLQEELKATVVYVTHDQLEAMTMSDRVAIMNGGQLQQYGSPAEVYHKPANAFVAGFIGSPSMNLIPVDLIQENGNYRLQNENFQFTPQTARLQSVLHT
jgi:multiple sugar transport system ATP-binding protein